MTEKGIIIDTKELWTYNYKVEYYCKFMEETVKHKGIVLAKNVEDAFNKIKAYYLEVDEEFISISIKEQDTCCGEISSLLVFEDK